MLGSIKNKKAAFKEAAFYEYLNFQNIKETPLILFFS